MRVEKRLSRFYYGVRSRHLTGRTSPLYSSSPLIFARLVSQELERNEMNPDTSHGAQRVAPTKPPVVTVTHIVELRQLLAAERASNRTVGLVPTMGALHEGHLSLIDRSRNENDVTVVTLFVNPTQFRPGEDLDQYPRQFEQDRHLAEEHGADFLFAPTTDEIYPNGHATRVSVAGISEHLCGDANRRGSEHFTGVATVVTKLFNIVAPDRAYFGQKDAQQVSVIKQFARDLNIPVDVVVCPTVREQDGLAMSSRNAYLSPDERERALSLWNALSAAREAVFAGQTDAAQIIAAASVHLEAVELEYFELVDPDTLIEVERIEGKTLAAIAARCGNTRLIDNLLLQPVDTGSTSTRNKIPTQSISARTSPSTPIYQGAVA